MNPFSKEGKIAKSSGTYSGFVYSQVSEMKIDESKKVDTGERGDATFRMTLRYVESEKMSGAKFRTKKDIDGCMWVLRVK